VAVVHSRRPRKSRKPSGRRQRQMCIRDRHLTGRRFEHGVTDCYTLFRDAYHLAGTEMPDFHREDDWWRNGQNLYLDNMAVTGFYRVPLSSAQAGDILLCCFGASVPNHAAIYCGNGE
ncbi:NlpC/P60 family protein, partial [Escherichia coli]|uniref:NlpC/P60 family protein n=1 Tax=Escherichia coli TaxID=562 RepID=UPI003D0697F2